MVGGPDEHRVDGADAPAHGVWRFQLHQGLAFNVETLAFVKRHAPVQSVEFTNSQDALPIAPNLLNQNLKVAALDRVWVTGITYLATDEGWLYLAGLEDLYSGERVGYAMGERMTKNPVMQALIRAVATRRPAAGLICHSDRGSQYCAHANQHLLDQFGMIASMSRKGDCYDNASIESFWGTLKNELVHHQRYITKQQAKDEVAEYIEMFYNRQQTQTRLGYVSPSVFTQKFYLNQLAV